MTVVRDLRHQYISAVTASILTLTVGFNLAWPSPTLPLLEKKDSPIGVQLDKVQSSWVSSISYIGILLGNIFLGNLQDMLGRRGLLLLSAIPTVISWGMFYFARSYEVLLAARFLCGLANVVPTQTSAVYIGEISDPKIRGKLGMFNLSMYELGIVVITIIGSYTSYFTTAIICGCVPIVFVLIFYWMPESPYFYLRKGDVDRARECLLKLSANPDVEKELQDMQACVEKEMKEKSNIWELHRVAKYRKAFFVGLGLKILQSMSGTIAINSYNKVIFEEVSTGLDSSQSAIISTAVSLPAVLVASAVIDKIGRKPLYYISTIGCTVSLIFEFIYFFMQNYLHSDVSDIGWLPISGLILYNIFRIFGIQTLATIILSEIFPTNMKAIGQNLVLAYSSLVGFLVVIGFPLLNEAWGIYTCFMIFAVCCLLGFFFIVFFVPETKGKSLEDIQNKIESGIKSNK